MAQVLFNLARPTQSSTVSHAIPLENRPDNLDDFSVPQGDFDIVIDGKVLRMVYHKPWDP